ncbi:hypothetical protein [Methylobacterium frigidaeris]|uniref:Uncharacterized protein n=1 Tax=Methylobacterium frigidaeris TaxID=2038277 RepID=A0AA37HJF2_9HYPH|nr:hypothetical protein [Methylobacterium frigidaeris]GJD66709.1 hypothetical protein MPEAHAMD_6907 [Methylobacterium frigidaeris]
MPGSSDNTNRSLKLPLSGKQQFFIVFLGFFLFSIIYQIFKPNETHDIKVESGASMAADLALDMANTEHSASTDTNFIAAKQDVPVLDHGTVTMLADFTADWNARRQGRQIILTHLNDVLICQSLVIPLEEHVRIMSKFNDDVVYYQKELIIYSFQAKAPNNNALSVEGGAIENDTSKHSAKYFKFEVTLSNQGRYLQQKHVGVWITNSNLAASLTCVQMRPDQSLDAMVNQIVKSYDFKS